MIKATDPDHDPSAASARSYLAADTTVQSA